MLPISFAVDGRRDRGVRFVLALAVVTAVAILPLTAQDSLTAPTGEPEPASVPPADAPTVPPADDATVEPRPTPVFASFERAWVIGNVDSLLGHFGKRKVYLSLPDGGPNAGLYSRNQSYFILKGLFDETRTEEFSFVSIRQAEDQQGTAIGRAERTFRRRDSSRLVQDRIFVSLVQEDARWVVAEIQSVR